jgi:hypothetical protein
MGGQPVWLASISKASPLTGRILSTALWSADTRAWAERRLRAALEGVGDPGRERLFRMNVTLCLHRAATDDEVAAQPPALRAAARWGLAGGPVEVLWENTPGGASTRPCAAPGRHYPGPDRLLWIPTDCGACAPCRARTRAAAAP